jgi:hypothetical protein
MPIVPGVQTMLLCYDDSLGADVVFGIGPFTNTITILRVIENCGADSSGTTLLNIDDAGTAGSGTTAIADKTAAVILELQGNVTEANVVNAADGYRLAAGNAISVTIDWTTPAILGYTLAMEYVEGIG